MTSLKDTIVFVTGASAGIGEAVARKFAAEGARLILAARRLEKLRKLEEELNTDCTLIKLDVRDPEAVKSSVEGLPDEWREIDILVNNAGLSRGLSKIQGGDLRDWEEMIDTNVKGLLYVSRAVLPGMVERNRGHVINIGSIAGHEVYPNGNVYCATKFSVKAITKGMLLDLLETNVRVTSIDPGLVETEFSEVRFRGDSERAEKVYQGYTPLESDDIAEAVVWAASRPQRVQIAEMIVLPTDQGGSSFVHKK